MDLSYLFQIEEGGYIRLPRKRVDLILDHITSCPCRFAIHRESNCGSVTRADVLFISLLPEQKRNEPKKKSHANECRIKLA